MEAFWSIVPLESQEYFYFYQVVNFGYILPDAKKQPKLQGRH